jgi:hypothetical protein
MTGEGNGDATALLLAYRAKKYIPALMCTLGKDSYASRDSKRERTRLFGIIEYNEGPLLISYVVSMERFQDFCNIISRNPCEPSEVRHG